MEGAKGMSDRVEVSVRLTNDGYESIGTLVLTAPADSEYLVETITELALQLNGWVAFGVEARIETPVITLQPDQPFKVEGKTGLFQAYDAFGEVSIIHHWPNGAARVLTDNIPGRLHFGSVEEAQAYLRGISPYRKGK